MVKYPRYGILELILNKKVPSFCRGRQEIRINRENILTHLAHSLMQTNLFVRNISYNATNQDLLELFEQIGAVESAKIILDRETQKSRGFGFVNMESADDAERAIAELDGVELSGRPIYVQEARPRE